MVKKTGMAKSNLGLLPFQKDKGVSPPKITRITDLRSVTELIEKQRLHFAPLSSFKDYTEGKKFDEYQIPGKSNKNENQVPVSFRRKVLYASCWYGGDETLHMWDIYGNKNKLIAIQVNTNSFLKHCFQSQYFRFESASFKEVSKRIKAFEFKPSSIHYGNISYIRLIDPTVKAQYYIGQFKDEAFEHEKEFRLLIRQNYKDTSYVNIPDLKCTFCSSELRKLKITLITSPYVDPLFFKTLKHTFQKHKNVKIIESRFNSLFK